MALIPPFFIDCVVAIGLQTTQNGNPTKSWIGTGFLFGNFISSDPNKPDTRNYQVYLVTNKHVLHNQKNIILRFNPQNGQPATDFPAALEEPNGNKLWTVHLNADTDVAVLPINIQFIRDAGMKFDIFKSDSDILLKQQLEDNQVSEGDFIFVLGFPRGMMPTDRQHVIVRNGIIARIRDLYENRSSGYIIDSLVFPGNSGGPVIYKPEIVSIQETPALNRAALIGIVKSYIPYQDVAISQQTQRPRIIFEENSGLANVETVDKIIETIQADVTRKTIA
ncbi:MAG TPA: serine protease [Saprospiraceae bacterium]|nr:serine protease [Saprospiraceae bacterium]